MSSNKNNNIFEKTSFLGNNSSEFVEALYSDYLSDPSKIPNEWRKFFQGLNENPEKIIKNANGPSWSRKKKIKNKLKSLYSESEIAPEVSNESINGTGVLEAAKNSVRANMLIRAYRIRGHLISNLDPLGLQKPEEHPELKPETYGFSKKDFKKKIFLDGVLGLQSATLNEILEISKKTYCQKIGYEFMHMGDPNEKQWIRDRIEGKEKGIYFTENGKKQF